MKKLFAYLLAFAVALFCAAAILSPAVAGAEDIIEADINISRVGIDTTQETPCLIVYFYYRGIELSWFENLEKNQTFDTTCQYHVMIFNSVEVLDTEPKELP